jgi:peroxiredoxin Q/BCP
MRLQSEARDDRVGFRLHRRASIGADAPARNYTARTMAKTRAFTVGDDAPAVTLESTSGESVSLADFAGRKVVLYFYPKDDTPGCTVEACSFRDEHSALQRAGAIVLGVSRDTLASHGKFRAKYELPFDLLSDPDNTVARRYGAFGKKVMYGREVEGTIRSTFLIDERGKLAAMWSPVKVAGHTAQVLAALGGGAAQAPRTSTSATKAAAEKAPARKTSASKAPAMKPAAKKKAVKNAPAKKKAAK